MTKEMEKKLEGPFQKPDEINAVFSRDPDQILANFADRGIEITKEELDNICSGIMDGIGLPENGELTEKGLEEIAGGVVDFISGLHSGLLSGFYRGITGQTTSGKDNLTRTNTTFLYRTGYFLASGKNLPRQKTLLAVTKSRCGCINRRKEQNIKS